MRHCCPNGTLKLLNCNCCSSEPFQVEIRTAPPALQMLRHQHACLVTRATISPLMARVGLLFHAGTSKCATLSLHPEYITLHLLQLTLHSKHIASMVVIVLNMISFSDGHHLCFLLFCYEHRYYSFKKKYYA